MRNPILTARTEWLTTAPSNNTMAKLPEEQFAQIVDWRWNGRLSQARCLDMANGEGFSVPGPTAFSEFWLDFSPFLRRAMAASDSLTVEQILADSKDPNELAAAIHRQLAAEVLALGLDPSRDQKDYLAKLDRLNQMQAGTRDDKTLLLKVRTLEQKSKTDDAKVEQSERRVKLLEDKMEKARQELRSAGTKGGLSAETIAEIEHTLGLL